MEILSKNLESALASGTAIKLELGCGSNPRKGFFTVDQHNMDGVDVVADLNKPLDLLPDDSCDYLYSRHVLEHIDDVLKLMEEIYRLTRPGGKIEIIVPHFSNVYAHSDPTHKRFFGLYSMYYFTSGDLQPKNRKVPSFYASARFRITAISIEFYRKSILDRIVSPVFSRLVNHNIATQDFYERRLSPLFHAWQIRYLMEPDK